jgi:hypothetical protein
VWLPCKWLCVQAMPIISHGNQLAIVGETVTQFVKPWGAIESFG